MDKTKAIQLTEFGGPEVLRLETVAVREPAPGEALISHTAIGLNMIDTYFRSGLYPLELPSGIGSEGAGTVEALGAGVDWLNVGDRVAYASPPPLGAYAEARIIDARWLVKLPDTIDDDAGAAMMLKGLTSWYLLRRSYPVRAGEYLLIYAAAGGVGSILTQWARRIGARAIGVVGNEAKRALALENGCEAVILSSDDIVAEVRRLTDGAGVPVVYDSIGKATFFQSLDCLRPHGYMVSFGNASGPVEPVSLLELMRRGSLYLTRPSLFDFIRARTELDAGTDELFGLVTSGAVNIEVNQRFSLADAASAHVALESRTTTGCTVLKP